MTAPRYQEVKSLEIPEIIDDDGTHVRLVCGSFWGKKGPVEGIAADPIYLDVSVSPGRRKTLPVETPDTPSPTFLRNREVLQRLESPRGPTEAVKWADTAPRSEADNRSLILSIAETMSPCEPGTTASDFCWSPESLSRSPSRGMVPSS